MNMSIEEPNKRNAVANSTLVGVLEDTTVYKEDEAYYQQPPATSDGCSAGETPMELVIMPTVV